MITTTISCSALARHPSNAKRASDTGPVIITDRGRPAYVLLRIDDYCRLTNDQMKIGELLAMSGIEDVELTIPIQKDLAIPASDLL